MILKVKSGSVPVNSECMALETDDDEEVNKVFTWDYFDKVVKVKVVKKQINNKEYRNIVYKEKYDFRYKIGKIPEGIKDVYVVVFMTIDWKEKKTLIANGNVFLLNNEGKTIERLN